MPIAIGILILAVGAYVWVLRSQVDARTAERDAYKSQVATALEANENITAQYKGALKAQADAMTTLILDSRKLQEETAQRKKTLAENATKFVTEVERLKAEAKTAVAPNLAHEQAAKTLLGLPALRGR